MFANLIIAHHRRIRKQISLRDFLLFEETEYLIFMLYLSQILGRPINDARGERIAVINDVLVRYGSEDYPPVIGVVARLEGEISLFQGEISVHLASMA